MPWNRFDFRLASKLVRSLYGQLVLNLSTVTKKKLKMIVQSKMGFCNDVAPNFDGTFRDYLRYANINRGSPSKERINVVCSGNFLTGALRGLRAGVAKGAPV